MLQIEDIIVSEDLLSEYFMCDLESCKGVCCIEGDSGAPVDETEIERLEAVVQLIGDDLSNKAKEALNRQGVVYKDKDYEYVTSLIDDGECVFASLNEDLFCRCLIEQAFHKGKTSFLKPISCHLYPVRMTHYSGFLTLNYHRWNICRSAIILGKKQNVKVFQFLKEPLIRRFGEKWYQDLCYAAEEWKN